MTRDALPWQLILADLALILFLVALSALAAMGSTPDITRAADAGTPRSRDIDIAPAQALFRPSSGEPDIARWLSTQDIDPRATLTVFALYRTDDQAQSWEDAQRMATAARAMDVPVRVVLTPAQRTDVYASLAFDAQR